MKFLIVTPRQRSGGSIVLHKLCKCLQNQGHESSVFYICRHCFADDSVMMSWLICILYNFADFVAKQVFLLSCFLSGGRCKLFAKYFYEPVKGVNRKWSPFISEDTIVVYPEIIFGNPLKAKYVVRWFLFHYRHKGKPHAYGKNDFFICYREIFNDPDLNPKGHTVCLGHFDSDLYCQINYKERSGCCYIVRKGKSRPDLPETWDGEVIDDYSEEEKVAVLNSVRYCYLYDTQSFYGQVAAACGAIPVVIPEPGKNRGDYLGTDEVCYGVAYGISKSEIEYALSTREKCLESLKAINSWADDQAKLFVKLCEQRFNDNDIYNRGI